MYIDSYAPVTIPSTIENNEDRPFLFFFVLASSYRSVNDESVNYSMRNRLLTKFRAKRITLKLPCHLKFIFRVVSFARGLRNAALRRFDQCR